MFLDCKLPHIEDRLKVEEVLMKTSRFSETQIIAILKQGESGIKVKDLCREHGISDPT